MGFSTGCLVAMTLSKIILVEKVILINPAEVLTRLNLNLLDSIVNDSDKDRNIYTFKPILKRTGLSTIQWKIIWFLLQWIWFFAMTFIGSKKLSKLYYYYQARHVNEPRADELEKLLFKPGRRFNELITTLVECILKPSLIDLIRNTNRRIYIVQGNRDYLYIPYVNLIYQSFLNVTLHRTIGDHHMIYHHPNETAQRISTIIK
jgi:pimeloyl-ACP methyl ester carboxylesterase